MNSCIIGLKVKVLCSMCVTKILSLGVVFRCRGKPQEKCSLCGTSYVPELKGTLCKVCQVSECDV